MKYFLRYFLLSAVLCFAAETALAQVQTYKELHKVKRKETIFGIARDNGVTVEELIKANPDMNTPGYELKKGDYIRIPFPASEQPQAEPAAQPIEMPAKPQVTKTDVRSREVRVGVMLPLHTDNGDGKRMLEYYRGVLMACDSLRANGISTDVRAWNVAEDSKIETFLQDEHAADRDVIIGPLYSKMVKPLSDFATAHDIRLLIPFSITTMELYSNPRLFQVYQSSVTLNESYVNRYMERFKDCHTIIINCNDTTSTKGLFTASLRRRLEAAGIKYSITNLRSSESMFQKSFSTTQRNVVVLNTGRQSELNVAFAKLGGLLVTNPKLQISMFGYTEWLGYTRNNIDNFYRFDVHIPSTYYLSPLSPRTDRFKLKYRWNFHQELQNYPQRFAVAGFDHAYFFLKGLHMYGSQFTGASGLVGYPAIQTPLHFEPAGDGATSGRQNRAVLFVHYTNEHRIETVNF